MKRHTTRQQKRGSALLAALFLAALLAALSLPLFLLATDQRTVSLNLAAKERARFAARSAIDVGFRLAKRDYRLDHKGHWSNGLLVLGRLGDEPAPGESLIDLDGSVTGCVECFYYDLAAFQSGDPGCRSCTPEEWIKATGGNPYWLPPPGDLPAIDLDFEMSGMSTGIWFLGVQDARTGGVYRPDRIRLLAIAEASIPGSKRPAHATILATLAADQTQTGKAEESRSLVSFRILSAAEIRATPPPWTF